MYQHWVNSTDTENEFERDESDLWSDATSDYKTYYSTDDETEDNI